MNNTEPSVIACVTDQIRCDRIINAARKIADDYGCGLRVLSVLKPMKDYSAVIDRIEYLNFAAKQNNADMTVLFSDNAAVAAADFADKNEAVRIVTGMHDGGDTSFLVMFNRLLPKVPITMVAENHMVYSMDLCECYS